MSDMDHITLHSVDLGPARDGELRLYVGPADLQERLRRLEGCERALEEYKTAEESGLLLRLPCKVGDSVYEADAVRVYESHIKRIIFDTDGIAFDESAIGESVFLTRGEAEAALARLNGARDDA